MERQALSFWRCTLHVVLSAGISQVRLTIYDFEFTVASWTTLCIVSRFMDGRLGCVYILASDGRKKIIQNLKNPF